MFCDDFISFLSINSYTRRNQLIQSVYACEFNDFLFEIKNQIIAQHPLKEGEDSSETAQSSTIREEKSRRKKMKLHDKVNLWLYGQAIKWSI